MTTNRLLPIEGLRAYLALWVVVCHVLWTSGYERGSLPIGLNWILEGAWAVNVFIVISGFVIVMLLDTKQEPYRAFIIRRFFRLFPVFIILFLLSIPLALISEWNLAQSMVFLTSQQITERLASVHIFWDQRWISIPMHVLMLHGIVPEIIAPGVPGAFLTPAWSISLEWQFYVLAPLLYACALSRSWTVRIGFWLGMAAMVLGARRVLPTVDFGAFLPFHAKWFVLGGLLYWLYRRYGHVWSMNLWPLTHPWILEAGKRSYSIYLSHALVIVLMQTLLLTVWPDLLRHEHMTWLLIGTLLGTGIVSMGLYRWIEVPGMAWGRRWATTRGVPSTSLQNTIAGSKGRRPCEPVV